MQFSPEQQVQSRADDSTRERGGFVAMPVLLIALFSTQLCSSASCGCIR